MATLDLPEAHAADLNVPGAFQCIVNVIQALAALHLTTLSEKSSLDIPAFAAHTAALYLLHR